MFIWDIISKNAKVGNDIHAQEKIEEMKAQGQLDYGIVFGGGGAKGAFQLGVWKKLDELGVAERFTGISGASVGALNAILLAQGDYQKAEAAWMKMKQGDLMLPNETLLNNFLQILGLPLIGLLPYAARVINILINWSENFGLFSRKKLERIARENITLEPLKDKLVYVVLSELSLRVRKITRKRELIMEPEYTYLDTEYENSLEININKVLASAALPGAFAPMRVNGKIYIDGGALDNAPVYPLIKAGYRNILVVHLKRRWKDGKDRLETFNKRLSKIFPEEELEGVTICHVWPQCSLKHVLAIDPDLTQWRIDAGYEAASDQIETNFFK